MSIMECLREWFRGFPELEGKRLNLDCLASDPESYSIDSAPTESVVTRYCDGSTVRRRLFTLSGRDYFGTELAQQDENAAFFDALELWVEEKALLMQWPDLGPGRTVRAIHVLQSGYPIEVESSDGGLLARYQAQMEIIYLQSRAE